MPIRPVDLGGSFLRGSQIADSFEAADERKTARERTTKLRDLFKSGLPADKAGRADLAGQAAALDPAFGIQLQTHFAGLDKAARDQAIQEAPIVGRAMTGVQDEESYQSALNSLRAGGIDVSGAPPRYDPRVVKGMIDVATAMQEPVKLEPPRSPERFDQDLRLKATGVPKGTTVNVGNQGIDYGDPPKDMAWARNPDGSIVLRTDPKTGFASPVAVPIAGGPIETAAAEAEVKGAEQEAAKSETKATSANMVLDTIAKIKEEMKGANTPVFGTYSIPFAQFSNTPAGKARSYIKNLQSPIVLDAMIRLKEASSTGATGFGQMNQKELSVLINQLGALEPDETDPEIMLDTLNRIEGRYGRVVDDIRRNVSPERIKELGLESLISTPGDKEAGAKNPYADMSDEEILEQLRREGLLQ